MNTFNFIKKYALAMVAVATIVTFSAFKATGGASLIPMTVAIYFHGNPMISTQVIDETLWDTEPNEQSCNNVEHKACMQHVEHTDLTSTGTLDPAKILLGSFNSGLGYIPTRIGGSSSTNFTPINRQ